MPLGLIKMAYLNGTHLNLLYGVQQLGLYSPFSLSSFPPLFPPPLLPIPPSQKKKKKFADGKHFKEILA